MIEKGIKLYGQADQFQMAAGNLLSFLYPQNSLQVGSLAKYYRLAVEAISKMLIEQVRKMPNGSPGSEEQKRKNWTIKSIRDMKRDFTKSSHSTLKSKLPYLRPQNSTYTFSGHLQ